MSSHKLLIWAAGLAAAIPVLAQNQDAPDRYTLSCAVKEVIVGRRLSESLDPGFRALGVPGGTISAFDIEVTGDQRIVFGKQFELPGSGNVRAFVSPGLYSRVSPSPGQVSSEAPLTRSILFGVEKVPAAGDGSERHPLGLEVRTGILAAREWLLNAGNLGGDLIFAGRYGLFAIWCSVKDQ